MRVFIIDFQMMGLYIIGFRVHGRTFRDLYSAKSITIWWLEGETVIIWLQITSWHNVPRTAEIHW